MNTCTDTRLQLFLAEQLPDDIEISTVKVDDDNTFTYFEWKRGLCPGGDLTGHDITPREWLWVVSEVEKKLSAERRYACILLLYDMTNHPVEHPDFDATWQQRTVALSKTLGKEIK